jgi:hypothetical protein
MPHGVESGRIDPSGRTTKLKPNRKCDHHYPPR